MDYSFTPIGKVRCDAVYTQETPRQGAFSRRSAVIVIDEKFYRSGALRDLEGASHIWIVWVFDRVDNWKPLVQPPTLSRKVGLFATRSPHRPNPIGITAAKLVKVERNILHVENIDLLDSTPVLDIKPYIQAADSIADTRLDWLDEEPFEIKEFFVSEQAQLRGNFIYENSQLDILETARVQLATRKLDPARQRLELDGKLSKGVLSFRTWRICFDYTPNNITVTHIKSGYTPSDLLPSTPDPYSDKALHRAFTALFEV